ncbi:hypothetical protein BG011_005625 [Mortierella polycephala]|uniref:Uncharacterized protein n=1 Tax=Mortierella polycephala TaxID=41804 RepID=A0A9P6U114_9FUNG|nr:hypothetical protein BG011_005625 [Mortierella polycephala]
MTKFDDTADFDARDISNILEEIDSVNLALDSLDGKFYLFCPVLAPSLPCRADKLTESLASLLRAQSQPNPFATTEAASLDELDVIDEVDVNEYEGKEDTDEAMGMANGSTVPPNSVAQPHFSYPTSTRAPPSSTASMYTHDPEDRDPQE